MGDELMVTGELRRLQRADPRKVRVEYGKGLKSVIFANNPRVAGPGDTDVQVYHARVNGLRPYCRQKSERRWTWCDYTPLPGELYFERHETAFADIVIPPTPASGEGPRFDVLLEPHLKAGASPNKDWGWERWDALAQMLAAQRLRLVQFGPPGTKVLTGTRLIQTPNFRLACAALSRVRAAVLPEGGLHHAAAAMRVPAVVIFGGYISPAQTGYPSAPAGLRNEDGGLKGRIEEPGMRIAQSPIPNPQSSISPNPQSPIQHDVLPFEARHVNLFTGREPCGWRVKCKHCEVAMRMIEPEQVARAALDLLSAQ